METCKQEKHQYRTSPTEADVYNVYTDEVIFNLVKINERKKKLEQKCALL